MTIAAHRTKVFVRHNKFLEKIYISLHALLFQRKIRSHLQAVVLKSEFTSFPV